MALTDKQRCFVDEYLVDLNATQAATRAGYSARTANEQGARLLANVSVAAAVAEAQKQRSERTGITADRVLAELAKIGFSDIRKAVSWKTEAVEAPVEERLEPQPHGGALKRSEATEVRSVVEVIASGLIDDDTAAAISEISQTDKGGLKIKLHDKRAALVDIGRHLGMFKEKVEHSGAINLNVSQEDAQL